MAKPLRVNPDFSIEIHPDSLNALRELSGDGQSLSDLRDFVRAEAEDALCSYLESNGIKLRRVRSVYDQTDRSWSS